MACMSKGKKVMNLFKHLYRNSSQDDPEVKGSFSWGAYIAKQYHDGAPLQTSLPLLVTKIKDDSNEMEIMGIQYLCFC